MGWQSDFRSDLQRYLDQGATPARALLTQQGLWAILEYRLARAARRAPLMAPVFMAWQKCVEAITGISISHGARIGPGLWITHFGGIVVHSSAVIGDDCHLCQGATIGRGEGSGGYGAPVIGNGVYVGPNAAVLGKITVGDGVRIGANSVVTEDVPAGSHAWPAPVVVTPTPEAPTLEAPEAPIGPGGR